MKAFEKATELKPDCEACWMNKGFALYSMRRYEEALKAFEESLRLNPYLENGWNKKKE